MKYIISNGEPVGMLTETLQNLNVEVIDIADKDYDAVIAEIPEEKVSAICDIICGIYEPTR
jgi:uncharacterized FlaG/YvyC family protein